MEQGTEVLLLEAIRMGRLSLLCGAGLSMAPPSELPSAWEVAQECRARYTAVIPHDLSSIPDDLEGLASYFHARGRFSELFLGELVPWQRLRGTPNAGHIAVADLLGCNALHVVVTTNFDRLIESAADSLGEPDFRAIVEQENLPERALHGPLLKIHGCEQRSRRATVWCKEQLTEEPVKSRVEAFQQWLRTNLQGRDLLIIGFWTDWAYFGDLLAKSLGAIGPRTIVLVAPDDPAQLESKAPALWTWAHSTGVTFIHERMSSEVFLTQLRAIYGRSFLHEAFNLGLPSAQAIDPKLTVPDTGFMSVEDICALRRDLSGEPSTSPVRDRRPVPESAQVAAIALQLLQSAWTYKSHMFTHAAHRVRLVFGRGALLSAVRKKFEAENPALTDDADVVCVGAVPDATPPSVVRAPGVPSIIRGGSGGRWQTADEWLTRNGGVPR